MHVTGKPRFTYGANGPFIKNKEKIKQLKKAWDSTHFHHNELDKAFFQHGMVYRD